MSTVPLWSNSPLTALLIWSLSCLRFIFPGLSRRCNSLYYPHQLSPLRFIPITPCVLGIFFFFFTFSKTPDFIFSSPFTFVLLINSTKSLPTDHSDNMGVFLTFPRCHLSRCVGRDGGGKVWRYKLPVISSSDVMNRLTAFYDVQESRWEEIPRVLNTRRKCFPSSFFF